MASLEKIETVLVHLGSAIACYSPAIDRILPVCLNACIKKWKPRNSSKDPNLCI